MVALKPFQTATPVQFEVVSAASRPRIALQKAESGLLLVRSVRLMPFMALIGMLRRHARIDERHLSEVKCVCYQARKNDCRYRKDHRQQPGENAYIKRPVVDLLNVTFDLTDSIVFV